MTLRARVLNLCPDALAVARAFTCAGLERVCLLHANEPGAFAAHVSFVGALPDASSRRLDPFEDDEPPRSGPFASTPRWIGVIPYESRRTLERPSYRREPRREAPLIAEPVWLRFPAVVRIDHDRGEVLAIGSDSRAVARLAEAARHPWTVAPARLSALAADPAEHHLARVRRAIELILAGDLYQVNLARRLDLQLEGHPLDAYAALAKKAKSAYGAALDLGERLVLSTTPELLLAGPRRGFVYSEPIKGTRPRGKDAIADARLAVELDQDEKERAELAMIIDVVRNDLGQVAHTGSVRLLGPPTVVSHATVHHRKALVSARLRPDVSRAELLGAMVPSGSVTGAPKIRAMEVIAELEAHRRGLYTGALGYAAYDGTFTLAMAIRTAVLHGAGQSYHGEYFTGGGIVADSDPERELIETRWKSEQLMHP
jgi:anthranilate/para-aminobenzoate synthase component I